MAKQPPRGDGIAGVWRRLTLRKMIEASAGVPA
jgi:hypothetical protein